MRRGDSFCEEDSSRVLAWVSSICILFLAVGLMGLRPRKSIEPHGSEPPLVTPVLLVPVAQTPSESPQPAPAEFQASIAPESVATEPMPEVISIIAAADLEEAAISIPVESPIRVAVAASVRNHLGRGDMDLGCGGTRPYRGDLGRGGTRPYQGDLDRGGTRPYRDGGSYPAPEYPAVALRHGWQGTVNIFIAVNPEGGITEVRVQESSGYAVLDDAAVEVVKKHWRFPRGTERALVWPCIFRLR